MIKKKKEYDSEDIPVLATDAKSVVRKKSTKTDWPKIQQGTHLTVKTFEDGSTELVWDDEQLLKEVREAIASMETLKKTKGKKK